MVLIVQISGFLGSGKTSTIINLATKVHERLSTKVAVIVNEIGDVDVDGEYLKSSGLYSKRLLGGCICCSLGGDLISAIKTVIEEYNPEILFVEPTGVALPSQVKGYFTQASYILEGLDFSPTVTLVDGTRFTLLLRDFRVFFNKQMRDADILVITKVDKIDKKFELPLIVSALRENHPNTKIIATSSITGEGLDELMQMVVAGRIPKIQASIAIAGLTNSVDVSEVGSADYYAKFTSSKPMSNSDVKSFIGEVLLGVGLTCKGSSGNFIGHIKSYVNSGTYGFKASLVDLFTGVEYAGEIPLTTNEFKASIFLAINSFDSETLEKTLKREVEKISKKHDLQVESLHEQH